MVTMVKKERKARTYRPLHQSRIVFIDEPGTTGTILVPRLGMHTVVMLPCASGPGTLGIFREFSHIEPFHREATVSDRGTVC